jgi:Spy/CpxP family protein refolding chaperone
MKSFRASLMVPMFALFATVAACSGQAQTDGSAQTNNAVTNAAADGKPAFRPMMGGPGMLVFAALHEPSLNLTEAQRATIQAAADTLKPKGPPPGAEAHGKALAAAVRAGKIDTATLAKPDITANGIEGEHKTALVNALNTLHQTLTKEQRVALVTAIASHKGKHGPMHAPNGEGPKGEHEGMKHHKGGQAHFGPMRMLDGLDLTADQQTAIQKELQANKPAKPTEAEREAMKAQHQAFKKELDARLQTFANDDFDANAYVAPLANAPKMGAHGDRFVSDLAAIVPLLTPAQREKLATKLEKGPAAFAPPAPAAK